VVEGKVYQKTSGGEESCDIASEDSFILQCVLQRVFNEANVSRSQDANLFFREKMMHVLWFNLFLVVGT
jgi:hypothetical protein